MRSACGSRPCRARSESSSRRRPAAGDQPRDRLRPGPAGCHRLRSSTLAAPGRRRSRARSARPAWVNAVPASRYRPRRRRRPRGRRGRRQPRRRAAWTAPAARSGGCVSPMSPKTPGRRGAPRASPTTCWPRSTTPSPGAPSPRSKHDTLRQSEAARVTPRFDSVRFGAPAYGRLSTAAPPELTRGAHDEGELGAYHFLWLAYRESQLQSGLPAYAPIGTGHRRPVRHLGEMMYGDFSRMTFSRAKAYTGVWSQQGRVQLDADANEQTAIVLDWLRTLAVDFIGPFGGHVSRAGFGVELKGARPDLQPGSLLRVRLALRDPRAGGTRSRRGDLQQPGARRRSRCPRRPTWCSCSSGSVR